MVCYPVRCNCWIMSFLRRLSPGAMPPLCTDYQEGQGGVCCQWDFQYWDGCPHKATVTVDSTIDAYLRLSFEEVKCLWSLSLKIWIPSYWIRDLFRFWCEYERSSSANDKMKRSLIKVVRRHLTPLPSSTNVERLFSYGGLVATDHRCSLSCDKINHILFLRENVLMANFSLGWL